MKNESFVYLEMKINYNNIGNGTLKYIFKFNLLNIYL